MWGSRALIWPRRTPDGSPVRRCLLTAASTSWRSRGFRRMTTITTKSVFAAALLMLLAVCAAPVARGAEEPAADVSKYLTFSFVAGDPKQAGVVADKQVRHRLQRMVTKQLM